MYYDINNQQVIEVLPGSATNSSGVLVQGLSGFDANTIADCGFLTVRSSTPQPENTIEDISQRNVSVDYPYADITRVWVSTPIVVPSTVSARQIRLWLIDNGIALSSVENAINTMEDEILKQKTLVEWEYAPYIERNHPLVNVLGEMLGLNAEQIDQGFIAASQL